MQEVQRVQGVYSAGRAGSAGSAGSAESAGEEEGLTQWAGGDDVEAAGECKKLGGKGIRCSRARLCH